MDAPLAVGGNRLVWDELPAQVRTAVESAAGSPVREAVSQPGGFSPGLASVLRLGDGRSVFAKAVSAARNPDSPDMHRREARILAALAGRAPAPRLLWSYDDGDWVVLLIEAVDGRTPQPPWRPAELAAFLDLAARLAERLTPAPVDPDAVTSVLAALTGAFVSQSRRPAPAGLPRVRAFQRAQGAAGLAWLRRRLESHG